MLYCPFTDTDFAMVTLREDEGIPDKLPKRKTLMKPMTGNNGVDYFGDADSLLERNK
jgi:hypothetical protein